MARRQLEMQKFQGCTGIVWYSIHDLVFHEIYIISVDLLRVHSNHVNVISLMSMSYLFFCYIYMYTHYKLWLQMNYLINALSGGGGGGRYCITACCINCCEHLSFSPHTLCHRQTSMHRHTTINRYYVTHLYVRFLWRKTYSFTNISVQI